MIRLCWLLLASAASAQAPIEIERYPWQAPVDLAACTDCDPAAAARGQGAYRIPVPVELRSLADPPEGSDVALVDTGGNLVPAAVLRGEEALDQVLAHARPTGGPDTYEVSAFDRPVEGLLVDLREGPSAATVQVERQTPSGWERWGEARLVWNHPVLGTWDRVPIPPSSGPFRVRLFHHGRRPAFNVDIDAWRYPASSVAAQELTLPVISTRLEEDGQARYTVRLPHALPIKQLRLHVEEPLFTRQVQVRDRPREEGYGGEAAGSIERTRIGGATVDRVTVPVGTPLQTDQLVLYVSTDGRPPLTIPEVTLELDGMELLVLDPGSRSFSLLGGAPAGTTPPADLQVALPELARMADATVAPGDVSPNPAWVPPEIRSELGAPGPELEIAPFRWRRPVEGEPGLVRISLPAEVLAESAPDLTDLRLLTAEGRQVPYVLRRLAEERDHGELSIEREEKGGLSTLRVAVPAPDVPLSTVTLNTSATQFRRQVTLYRVAGSSLDPLRSYQWVGEDRPTSLTLDLDAVVGQELVIQIDNGDDPPLPVSSVSATWPAWELVTLLPEGEVSLVYGAKGMGPPDYDLSLLSAELLPRAKAEARLGEAERLSPAPRSAFDEVVLLAGIGVLVAGLLTLTVRLVRGVPEPAAPPEEDPTGAAT